MDKILEPDVSKRKVWEVRSQRTSKRGVFALAPSGEKQLVGQVEIVDCFRIAKKEGDVWKPAGGDEANYIFHPDNAIKVGFDEASAPEYLLSKTELWAWVLCNPQRYEEPIKWKKKDGASSLQTSNENTASAKTTDAKPKLKKDVKLKTQKDAKSK